MKKSVKNSEEKSVKNVAKTSKKSAKKVSKTRKSVQEVKNPEHIAQKLIVAQFKYNRWYVYFKGIRPSENVGRGCKTAKAAIRYMMFLKAKYGAVISNNIYDRVSFQASMEA